MIKIQTGEDKGRYLKMPDTPSIRPTTNKVREALVNVLKAKGLILNARVLDLYAGTGAVGFELLSNGARQVTFVEKSRMGVATIKENAEKLKKTGFIKVIKEDALKALEILHESGEQFEIIYADPPYDVSDDEIQELEIYIARVLSKHGVFVLEHSSKRAFHFKNLALLTQKKYGDTILSFYGRVD